MKRLLLASALTAATALWPGLAPAAWSDLAGQTVDGALEGTRAPAPVEDPAREAELDAMTAEIGSELRCPVCRQQSVTESSSRIAREMQALIRTMLIEGRTPEEIEAYFVEAYGPWILLQPPAEGVNILVYALPAAAFLFGGLWVVGRMRASRAAADGGSPQGPGFEATPVGAPATDPRATAASPTDEADEIDEEDRTWLEAAIRGG